MQPTLECSILGSWYASEIPNVFVDLNGGTDDAGGGAAAAALSCSRVPRIMATSPCQTQRLCRGPPPAHLQPHLLLLLVRGEGQGDGPGRSCTTWRDWSCGRLDGSNGKDKRQRGGGTSTERACLQCDISGLPTGHNCPNDPRDLDKAPGPGTGQSGHSTHNKPSSPSQKAR